MQSLLLTLSLIGLSVLLAVPLGTGLALALALCGGSRYAKRLRSIATLLLLVLICLPMYLHAAAWEATAGKYGWIPLMQANANRFWFTGLTAAAWVHGVSGAAWVALATLWGLRQVPSETLRQASLETTLWQRLWHIGIPAAKPAITVAALWVALLASTEMTVADLYGVRTLADRVYLQYAFAPETLPIALACAVPLLIATVLAAFLSRLVKTDRGRPMRDAAWASTDHVPFQTDTERGWLPLVAASLVAGILLAIVVVPLLSLIVKAGLLVQPAGASASGPRYSWSMSRWLQTLSESFTTFGAEYYWTFVLALATSLIALVIAILAAAWADGSPTRARIGFFTAVAMVVLPGPVVGMVVVHLFHNQGDFLSTLYQRSIFPTVVALLPRAGPASYLVMRAGFRMLDRSPHEAAKCDGVSWLQRLLRVDLPRLWAAVGTAALAAAIVAIADVPATLVVLPPGISTLGTRIFGLLHSGVRYQAAGLAITSSLLVAFVVVIAYRIHHLRLRRRVG